MKILFLDDDRGRIALAREAYNGFGIQLSIAETAEQAIRMLKKYSPYDLVSLDHDLGGEAFVPSDERSGHAVAKFIATMSKDKMPKQVVIHSYNPAGAQNMLAELIDIVPVVKRPFNL